jgi:hypothetical protein
MRAEKAKKYNEIKKSGNKEELEEWFLNYKPGDKKNLENLNKETTAKKGKTDKTKKTKSTKTKKTKSTKTKKTKSTKTKKNKIFGIYG